MAKQHLGETKTPFTLKSGNSTPFKMIGNSPMKQDVGVHTGFGPEADANLKKKINVKADKPVVPKKVKKGLTKKILKGIGKVASRVAGPVGWGLAAWDVYDAAKWTYKNRKELAKEGKKVQKQRFERSKSGFDPFTPKY